jgi:ubiquinol-cytochrome c reductase cytochrome b subunit
MGFVEGAIRIMPNWESHIGGTTWSWNVAIPGLGTMGLFFGLMALYPFLEAWVTKDKAEHHILERPRNNPTRTGFGVAAMTAYGMLWIGGGNDLVATQFHVSLNAVTYFLRVAVFVMPVLAFMVTKRICIGLQRSDEERLLHGAETGIIERDPSGAYSERHAPISQGEAWTLTQHRQYAALMPAESDPDLTDGQLQRENLRRRASRFYFIDTLRKPTRAELEEAAHHHGDGDGDGNGHEVEGDGNGHHSITAGTTQNVVPNQ